MPQDRRSVAKARSRQLVQEIRSLKQRSDEILLRLEELARQNQIVEKRVNQRPKK